MKTDVLSAGGAKTAQGRIIRKGLEKGYSINLAVVNSQIDKEELFFEFIRDFKSTLKDLEDFYSKNDI